MNKFLLSRKIVKDLDFGLLFIVLLLFTIGIINIYSATFKDSGLYFVKRQLFWIGFSFIVMYFVILIDYSIIGVQSEIAYWFFNGMLLITFFVAEATNGAKGWLYFFRGVGFQTSEFAKVALCIFLSKKISEFEGKINNLKELMVIIGYSAITMFLIVIEPDMGMTLLCFFMVLGIIFIAETKGRYIVSLLSIAAGLGIAAINASFIPPYWKSRIFDFLNSGDSAGRYQVSQSIIAIGSGQIYGLGFLKSIKVGSGYVPEASTDFIFSVVGEEWGLIGAAIVIVLYIFLIYRVLRISKNAKNSFGKIFTAGIASLWIFQFFQNIGMTMGLMPVTGVTLPFMSYGGSSLLSNFIALGLILNIGMRKKKLMF